MQDQDLEPQALGYAARSLSLLGYRRTQGERIDLPGQRAPEGRGGALGVQHSEAQDNRCWLNEGVKGFFQRQDDPEHGGWRESSI